MTKINPMLLHHAEQDFVLTDDWVLEIKYDGVRVIVDSLTSDEHGEHGFRIYTRNGVDITKQFPEVSIPPGLLLDGEIVGITDKGFHKLNWVQRRLGVTDSNKIIERTQRFPITFVAFDHLNDLSLDYEKRMHRLDGLNGLVSLSPRYPASTIDKMWEYVIATNLEGLVAKNKSSMYVEGQRTYQWRKIKHEKPEYRNA